MGGSLLSRLVVVSNRVSPARNGKTGAEGGLAVAVQAALSENGGLWFGWSGKVSPDEAARPTIESRGNVTYATINLTQRDYDEYYNGFANRCLWPVFHYRLDLAEFGRREMVGYLRVNDLFATQLLPLLEPGDLVWVHDYHLIPLAEQLRQVGCQQRVGFFLHIPWPAVEVLVALPNHQNLVKALCAYDVVGFQTETDLHNFREYITREVGGQSGNDGVIYAFGRQVIAGAYPIGIDTENVARFAQEAESSRLTERLRDSVAGRQLIIGVDRLDYTKGLIRRFHALEHLLRSYPENRGRVVMLQITPPSRTEVPSYEEIQRELEETASHVNGSYAEFDWMPIRYLNKSFSRKILAGFLRIGRIGLVTPLRDGMNLVAKEYVAAQDPDDPGVLVLSRFAGAARELGEALIVNPFDVEAVGECLQEALHMPLDERRDRWSAMYEHLCRNDVTAWRKAFLTDLSGLVVPRVNHGRAS